jgi:hypothetical protein
LVSKSLDRSDAHANSGRHVQFNEAPDELVRRLELGRALLAFETCRLANGGATLTLMATS